MRYLSTLLLLSSLLFAKPTDTIHVGFADSNSPYSYLDSSETPVGILIDWWILWGESNDTRIVFDGFKSYSEVIDAIQNKDVDVIAGLYYSEERAKILKFGTNIIRSEFVLYSQSTVNLETIDLFKDTIGVVIGDFAVNYLVETYPNSNLKTYPSYAKLQSDIMNETIEAFVYDEPKAVMQQRPRFLRSHNRAPIPSVYAHKLVLSEELFRPAVLFSNDELAQKIIIGSGNVTEEDLLGLAKAWGLFWKTPVLLIAFISAMITIVAIFTLLLLRRRRRRYLLNHPTEQKVESMISKGETDLVEFKSSLRYDYKQQCSNKALEHVIVKTISAFMNSKGGTLIIGVDDEGEVLGLENDYQSLNKKNADGFLLGLTSLINNHIGKKYHRYLSMHILGMYEKEVCWIGIRPSSEPVFVGKGGKEEFYIRASVSSQPLSIRECYEYIEKQWRRKSRQ